MSLGDIYNFIGKIQDTIGANCRVNLSIAPWGLLEIKVEWLYDSRLLTFTKVFSRQELRYIQDEDILVGWFCREGIRYHKKATVGEE